MRAVVRTLAWVLLFAAIGGAGAAWATPVPDLERGDAARVAVGAMAAVGRDARIVEGPRFGSHRTVDGDEIDVWITVVGFDGEEIELDVQVDAGQLVYVDDVRADGLGRVLTDEEFEALGAFRDDAVIDRWVRRNGIGSLAAALVAAVCYALHRQTRRARGVRDRSR